MGLRSPFEALRKAEGLPEQSSPAQGQNQASLVAASPQNQASPRAGQQLNPQELLAAITAERSGQAPQEDPQREKMILAGDLAKSEKQILNIFTKMREKAAELESLGGL